VCTGTDENERNHNTETPEGTLGSCKEKKRVRLEKTKRTEQNHWASRDTGDATARHWGIQCSESSIVQPSPEREKKGEREGAKAFQIATFPTIKQARGQFQQKRKGIATEVFKGVNDQPRFGQNKEGWLEISVRTKVNYNPVENHRVG